jgi:hypothetical protein
MYPLGFMQRLAALVPLSRMLAPALFPRRSWANGCFASTNSGH